MGQGSASRGQVPHSGQLPATARHQFLRVVMIISHSVAPLPFPVGGVGRR
jgi:hypothetical protein